MSRKAPTSTKCALDSCSRPVRFDNPTAPFCSHHVGMKQARSSFANSDYLSGYMEEARDILYNPRKSMLTPAAMSVSLMAAASKISGRDTIRAYKAWKLASDGVDHSRPDEALEARTRINDELADEFSDMGYEVERATCSDGLIRLPEKGYRPVSDHEVLLVDKAETRLIVDGATAAPLVGITDDVNKLFPSGESTMSDGLYIAQPFEYAAFSSATYGLIETSNGPVWEAPKTIEEPEVASSRELAASQPQAFPPVIYWTPPPEDEDQGEYREPTLEELIASRKAGG